MARGPTHGQSTAPVSQVFFAANAFGCELIHLAGCDDPASSYGSQSGGILSNALLEAQKKAKTYRELIEKTIAGVDPRKQVPYCTAYGVSDKFWNTAVYK